MVLKNYNSLSNETPIISQIVLGSELTKEEIQDCGQAVVYVESRYLGLVKAPVLYLKEDEESYFDHESNSIFLSIKDIEDWRDYIKRIIHLTYHAYEQEQIELYHSIGDEYKKLKIFWEVKSWSDEKNLYTFCDENCNDLWIEKDAVEYANEGIKDYIQAVCQYWHYSEEYLNIDIWPKKESEYLLL